MDTQPQELRPPGRPMPRIEGPKDQLRAYQAEMRLAYIRAFPPYGKSTAKRLRNFYGRENALNYYAVPSHFRSSWE
jgi:hypothetical protein